MKYSHLEQMGGVQRFSIRRLQEPVFSSTERECLELTWILRLRKAITTTLELLIPKSTLHYSPGQTVSTSP